MRRFTRAVPRFEVRTQVAASPARCFELSLSVDAHAASMSFSGERAVDGITSGQMVLGDTVTWRARHFGVWFRMTSAITAYDHPARFVDEQIRGPFATWWHEHRFEASTSGGTEMIDVIEFRSPGGPIGSLIDRLLLARYMAKLIRQRNGWLRQILESSA
jgi:ligand-binding SRPBCC domain-containing protein